MIKPTRKVFNHFRQGKFLWTLEISHTNNIVTCGKNITQKCTARVWNTRLGNNPPACEDRLTRKGKYRKIQATPNETAKAKNFIQLARLQPFVLMTGTKRQDRLVRSKSENPMYSRTTDCR